MVDPGTGSESSTPLATGPNASAAHRIVAASAAAAARRKRNSAGGMRAGTTGCRGLGRNNHAATSAANAIASASKGPGSRDAAKSAAAAKLVQPAVSATGHG